MRATKRARWALAAACGLLCALTGLTGVAHAQDVACGDLPNPIYLQVGDTQEPLLKNLGRALANSAVQPMTLVYVTSGSCTNIEAIYADTKITKNPFYVPSSTANAGWTPKDPSPTCTIPDGGHAIDVANSALFVSACNPAIPPAGIKLFQGPVQGYSFVVPEASLQKSITAEQGYFVFGFGNGGMAEPWTDEAFMYIRTVTKSTLLSMAAAISVPADKWRGQRFDKSSEVLSALTASTNPEKSIGILGVELYDQHRDQVNVLAYRAYGQRYAYYPDSSATSFDKRNVRDGHYVPWSPTVWLTKVDTAGAPVDPRAKYLIDSILGLHTEPAADFEALDIVTDVGLVPDCAMRVTRSVEGGELSLYEPAEPCGCHYESRVTKATPAGCVPCDAQTPCASGVCRHDFCEAR
ncbi:MAG: hypothetical protein QM778_24100 [Myxococcales bacterium]